MSMCKDKELQGDYGDAQEITETILEKINKIKTFKEDL